MGLFYFYNDRKSRKKYSSWAKKWELELVTGRPCDKPKKLAHKIVTSYFSCSFLPFIQITRFTHKKPTGGMKNTARESTLLVQLRHNFFQPLEPLLYPKKMPILREVEGKAKAKSPYKLFVLTGYSVLCPLLSLCRPYCIFEWCLDSKPESSRRKQERYTEPPVFLKTERALLTINLHS